MTELQGVFGVGVTVDTASYVDRGGLDARFRWALNTGKHIAVHGGSKQGKSWLRSRALDEDKAIVIQCTPSATPDSLLREALGCLGVRATIKLTSSHDLQGTLDFKGNIEVGVALLGKTKIDAEVKGQAKSGNHVETELIGQTPGDLSWVSKAILESGKRLVLEDFHYVDEKVQRQLAFMLKAMGEYGLFVVVVGVWPKDHLLTYYNGDLDGRVEDIHLTWLDSELAQVLENGAKALNIKLDDSLVEQLVQKAYGNVGLLQRLIEQLCVAEGILRSHPGFTRRRIDGTTSFPRALVAVAEQMQGRYQTFADNFVRGMRRLPEGLEVYRHLLETVTEADDLELRDGIDSKVLLERINTHGSTEIRPSDLTQALDRLDRLQVKIDVNPLVLTYNKSGRKLTLADRSFLFYRSHGNPRWPWNADEPEIVNDLFSTEPLDF